MDLNKKEVDLQSTSWLPENAIFIKRLNCFTLGLTKTKKET